MKIVLDKIVFKTKKFNFKKNCYNFYRILKINSIKDSKI